MMKDNTISISDLITRHFTKDIKEGKTVFDLFKWKRVDVLLKNYKTGKVLCDMKNLEFPESYSQNACDIIASKYFRKAGVPETGNETSMKQVANRLALFYANALEDEGLIKDDEHKKIFYDEIVYALLAQMFAPNSPAWFNCGLKIAYGIEGKARSYYYDESKHIVVKSKDDYTRAQTSACFILSIDDSLVGPHSISDQLVSETKLFKNGSGVGSNFSAIRAKGEKLSGGGKSSGLMSFLKVFDRNAGAIKSGGTCLAPYQKVYTERGAIPVKELAESGEKFIVLSYDPPSGRFKAKYAKAWLAGKKSIMRLTTNHGEYDITFDHPVSIANTHEYIKTTNLKKDQHLLTCHINKEDCMPKVVLKENSDEDQSLTSLISNDLNISVKGIISNIVYRSDNNTDDNIVQSVKMLGYMDVYDVEVDCPTIDDKSPNSGHNFVIWSNTSNSYFGAGIVVSNTRRAAKMVCLDVDHPEIMDFITWKAKEEKKVRALGKMGYDTSIDGEAYETVAGQNANNSIRLSDEFMKKVENLKNDPDAIIELKGRVDSSVNKVVKVKDIWEALNKCAWECADPAVQFNDTFNKWNTCPLGEKGNSNMQYNHINSSNPCVSAETRLLTTSGYVEIGKLDGQEVDIINELGQTSHSKVWCSGIKEIWNIKLEDGKLIRCTENQLFKTCKINDDGSFINEITEAKNLEGKALSEYAHSNRFKKVVSVINTHKKEKVYDFTEPLTHWGVIEGFIAHNCGEYAFLDDTSCNLASINVYKFFNENIMDIEGYKHLIHLCQLILEASIQWGQYPTKDVARMTYKFRTTGLGISNLASTLMSKGYPYDSSNARDLSAGILGILTGESYYTSALMAKEVGAFYCYNRNKKYMAEVITNHKKYLNEYEDDVSLSNVYDDIDELLIEGIESFDRAINYGLNKGYGYRNAQVTVIAPTGTISFAMDCAATSIEPFFGHVIYKKLVGGGSMVLTNPIIRSVLEHSKLWKLKPDLIDNICSDIKNGESIEKYEEALRNANIDIAIFDTANKCNGGKRYIDAMGHVKMMAKLTPLISGSISKTVNLPSDATIDDFKNVIYKSWKLGIKGITLYRDGSKTCQPLNTNIDSHSSEIKLSDMDYDTLLKTAEHWKKSYTDVSDQLDKLKNHKCECSCHDKDDVDYDLPISFHSHPDSVPLVKQLKYKPIDKKDIPQVNISREMVLSELDNCTDEEFFKVIYNSILNHNKLDEDNWRGLFNLLPDKYKESYHPVRTKLDGIRKGITHHAVIDGVKIYVTLNKDSNMHIKEIYITTDREGTIIMGLLNSLSKTISVMLQYGIDPDNISKILRGQKYEPYGFVQGHPYIKHVESISDLISKIIDIELGDYSRCQVKPKKETIYLKENDTEQSKKKFVDDVIKSNKDSISSKQSKLISWTPTSIAGCVDLISAESQKEKPDQKLIDDTINKFKKLCNKDVISELETGKFSMKDFIDEYTDQYKELNKVYGKDSIDKNTNKKDGEKVYGQVCPNCGSTRMIKNGTCYVCRDCGTTTGCS